ncbi:S1 family peptidase [Amycolatopsis nigrescens]|uniref:S1 family peptidase n=1 Tax=Amycolatopsis nigrescens TaxID=381445 RepID=UPI00037707B6|nr:S1 family peptidase [Amycolatopsis nigrescens]
MSRRSLHAIVAFSGAAVTAAALATPAAATPALGESAGPAALAAAHDSLSQRLGGTFANSWLDIATGRLVVGVTDSAMVAEVHAAGAVAKVLPRSAAQLKEIQSTLDRRAGTVPDTVAGWYVDAPANEVVVSVVNEDAAGLAWARSAGTGPLRVERVAEAPRPLWNVIGGQAIYFGGGRCSVGFNAYNEDDDDDRFVITAGHCTELGGTVRGTGGTVGPVARSSFPGNDYGTIRVRENDVDTPPRVDRYDEGSDVRIQDDDVVEINGRVCRSGSTTGWHCGRVRAYDQTVNYGNGDIVHGLTQTDACAEPGDSGGSFVSRPDSDSNQVQAQGMTSGGSGNCGSGGITFFQPVREVLNRYDLKLETD